MKNNNTPDKWKYLNIILHDKSYYYINRELIKNNEKTNFFNLLYIHIIYVART